MASACGADERGKTFTTATEILDYCRGELPAMLRLIEQAVEMESPSGSKVQIDRMAEFFAAQFRELAGEVKLLRHPTAGTGVVAEFWPRRRAGTRRSGGRQSGKSILVLGHHDTVWPVGTIARMPFRVSGGRAWGPGIFDMKSGIVLGLTAVRSLKALGIEPGSPVRFFLNPDEEVSSIALRDSLIAEARRARAVLVLEPAASGGALKTARKGVGEFRITVTGRSAHAGINPGAGVNAISELARQLLLVERFQNARSGLTVTAGTIEGGTRSNVVPERATAAIDVRIPRLKDRRVIERKMRGLKPFLAGARVEVTGGINRPPMERKMARDLYAHAHALAKRLGWELRETATGGGSDGNFTAALGVPTLDGLGAVGDGAHARDEHVVIRELPRRAALIAALLATL